MYRDARVLGRSRSYEKEVASGLAYAYSEVTREVAGSFPGVQTARRIRAVHGMFLVVLWDVASQRPFVAELHNYPDNITLPDTTKSGREVSAQMCGRL